MPAYHVWHTVFPIHSPFSNLNPFSENVLLFFFYSYYISLVMRPTHINFAVVPFVVAHGLQFYSCLYSFLAQFVSVLFYLQCPMIF